MKSYHYLPIDVAAERRFFNCPSADSLFSIYLSFYPFVYSLIDAIASRGQSVGLFALATKPDRYTSGRSDASEWGSNAAACRSHNRCSSCLSQQRWTRQRMEALCIIAGTTKLGLHIRKCNVIYLNHSSFVFYLYIYPIYPRRWLIDTFIPAQPYHYLSSVHCITITICWTFVCLSIQREKWIWTLEISTISIWLSSIKTVVSPKCGWRWKQFSCHASFILCTGIGIVCINWLDNRFL